MKRAWIIVQHEFLSRIRRRAFIISTVLAPLTMVLVIAIPILIMQVPGASENRIAILDQSGGRFAQELHQEDSTLFALIPVTEDSLRHYLATEYIDGYLLIPPTIHERDSVVLFTRGAGGLSLHKRITDAVHRVSQREHLREYTADTALIYRLSKRPIIERIKISPTGTEQNRASGLFVMGYGLSFVIYILLFIYGGIVMRSVLEEKTNRIVELLASSARPFDIMVGKVIGVGAVGLFQVMLWILLSSLVMTGISSMLVSMSGTSTMEQAAVFYRAQDNELADLATQILTLPAFSVWYIVAFLFFFLAGYFFYSTLFAGIAAAADQEEDAQMLQAPVSIFIVLPMLTITAVLDNPGSTISIVLSILPMFSPIVMVMRIFITDVPWWQLAASVVFLGGSVPLSLWLAGRIYRVGILRYGQRPSFRQLVRWIIEG